VPDSTSHPLAMEGRTLLAELDHHIKNELASMINLVSFKAVWTDNVDAKEELSNVVDLLHQHVEVPCILTMPDRDARGLLLRVYIQAIWHPARSGLSWKLIEADGPLAPRSGANLLGRTQLASRAVFRA
jgi:hypothetical protein